MVQGETPVCGYYVCKNSPFSITGGYYNIQRYNCNSKNDCENTDYDEEHCSEDGYKCFQQSELDVPRERVCDGVCHCKSCDDEAICNGHRYGMFYKDQHNRSSYLPPNRICNGKNNVLDGSDELNCTELGRFCKIELKDFGIFHGGSYVKTGFRLLRNDSVCSVPKTDDVASDGDCVDGFDQINCTDTSLAPLKCKINGTESTVSKYVICKGRSHHLCDNGLDTACVYPEGECRVHKHQVCDGVADCPEGGDEAHRLCRSLTNVSCLRRFSNANAPLKILLEWVGDGVEDCKDGIDEQKELWKQCGKGVTERFIKNNESCNEVLLCPNGQKFITQNELCDQQETCSTESNICSAARKGDIRLGTKFQRKPAHPFCLKGLEEFLRLRGYDRKVQKPLQCHKKLLETPEIAFGVKEKTIVQPNRDKADCKYTFGESYVYHSCSGQCSEENAKCVLSRTLKHNSCFNRENRLYTLAGGKDLTIAFKSKNRGEYDNSVFSCKNGKCIDYDKVCNLENDCGDHSDESECINHFKCNGTDGISEYIPLWRVCDGNLNCLDYTDECNPSCRGNERIIDGNFLSVFAWAIGILATVLNIGTLFSISCQFNRTASNVRIINLILVVIIIVGDLLIGLYLIGISVASTVYGDTYCTKRFEWLTSSYCQLFGVVSTVGGQLSLFAMTILSLVRMVCVKAAVPNYTFSRNIVIGGTLGACCIFLLPLFIAVIPLMSNFENFFVNGWVYLDSTLFIGAPNKHTYISVISAYYNGKIKTPDVFQFSWLNIRNLIEGMFSDDHKGLQHKPLNFYGNHGTCLFKYFVTSDDPQSPFTWALLGVNLCCFFVISYCYIWIFWKSMSSSSKFSTSASRKQTSKQRVLQQKIALMVITDFLSWVPFTVVCILHYCGTIDATKWYPLFSSVILPLNSVINPLLYDSNISSIISKLLRRKSQETSNNTVKMKTTLKGSYRGTSLKLDEKITGHEMLAGTETSQHDV